jgi:hypothetical protein
MVAGSVAVLIVPPIRFQRFEPEIGDGFPVIAVLVRSWLSARALYSLKFFANDDRADVDGLTKMVDEFSQEGDSADPY